MAVNNENVKESLANLIKKAKEEKIVSREEVNKLMKGMSQDKIDMTFFKLSEMGIEIVNKVSDKNKKMAKKNKSVDIVEKLDIDDEEVE